MFRVLAENRVISGWSGCVCVLGVGGWVRGVGGM